MPAHIGFSDVLKTVGNFLVMNLSQSHRARQVRQMRKRRNGTGIISPGYLWQSVENNQERREHKFASYDQFRAFLDTYDPTVEVGRDRINERKCDRTEWELYLQPGTDFDQVCAQFFVDYPEGKIILITHKKRVQALKRIETKRPGRPTRIIWSEA
jgi:hypothetical protein